MTVSVPFVVDGCTFIATSERESGRWVRLTLLDLGTGIRPDAGHIVGPAEWSRLEALLDQRAARLRARAGAA